AAAEQDVVAPWTAGEKIIRSHRLTRQGQTWLVPFAPPPAGSLPIRVTLPKGGGQTVALLGANRRTVLKRATATGLRLRTISTNVCGQRSLNVRVVQQGSTGRVTVSVAKP